MKIVILIKQVVDVELNIKVKDDGNIQEDGLQYVLSAHDECAVEEAIQIKEKTKDAEITLVSIGPARATEAIRKGLALGADKAIHLQDDAFNDSDSTAAAKAFAALLKGMEYDIIMGGKQAQDTDMQATCEILSEILGLPMVSNGKKMEISGNKVNVHRQADGMLESVDLETPCIVTVNNDINNPRNPSLKGIMSAKKKPLEAKKAADIGVDAGDIGKAGSLVERVKFQTPPPRAAGKKFEGDAAEITQQVIDLLANEAKVIG